jgi:transposase-like protein
MKVKRRNDPNVRAFWTRHVALWMRGPFSQREYCERNGISLSLMSKWWIWLREGRAREERINIGRCRGRGRLSPMTKEISHRSYVPPTCVRRRC